MNKVLAIVLSIISVAILSFGGMYAVDMNRMRKNLPVIFSTWGYSYAPPTEPISEHISGEERNLITLEELPENYTFEMAIENGDIVVGNDGIMRNDNRFTTFKENVSNKIDDIIRVVTYTIEGDPIITEYEYKNDQLIVRTDASRDEFGASNSIQTENYNIKDYSFMDITEDGSTWHRIYLVKKSQDGEEWQSKPLDIEDKIYILSYKEYESSLSHYDDKESFVGTIVEEKNNYIIVEPNEDESERKSADKITIPIKDTEKDYIYGVGKKVLIEYTGEILESYPAQISDAIIKPDGYSDFKIEVELGGSTFSSSRGLKEIDPYESDRTLYITGFEEVNVRIGKEIYSFNDALDSGKITANGLLSKANEDNKAGLNEKLVYKDGGSTVWRYSNYAILKMNTLDGDNDILIGPKELTIEDFNKLREVRQNGGGKNIA